MIKESALGLAFLAQPTCRQLGVTFTSQATTSLTGWEQTCQLSLRDVSSDVVAHRESPHGLFHDVQVRRRMSTLNMSAIVGSSPLFQTP